MDTSSCTNWSHWYTLHYWRIHYQRNYSLAFDNIGQWIQVHNNILYCNKYHRCSSLRCLRDYLDIQDRLREKLFWRYNQSQANSLYISVRHSGHTSSDHFDSHRFLNIQQNTSYHKNLADTQFHIEYHKLFCNFEYLNIFWYFLHEKLISNSPWWTITLRIAIRACFAYASVQTCFWIALENSITRWTTETFWTTTNWLTVAASIAKRTVYIITQLAFKLKKCKIKSS